MMNGMKCYKVGEDDRSRSADPYEQYTIKTLSPRKYYFQVPARCSVGVSPSYVET